MSTAFKNIDTGSAPLSKILFVSYGGGHVAMLAPVAKAMLDAGQPVVFLALTTAAVHLARLNIPFIGYRQLPGADDEDVQAYGHQLAQSLPAGGPVAMEETVAYLGLNYRELVRAHGQEQAASLYASKGRQAFLPVNLFESWLAELRPAAVIATNSPRSEQAALLAAARLGIPSVCAVDIFGLQEVQWIGQPGYGQRVCVLNEQVRRMFLSHGRREDEVVVTGNPAFQRLQTDQARCAGLALRAERAWGDDERVILWASQIEPEKHPFAERWGDPTLPRRTEAELRHFVASHPGFRLVIRYHPSERVEFSTGQDRVDFSPSSEDLAALLHAVDMVVVTASTVGLEAYLAGRPVISVDASVFTPDAPYSSMGISVGVQAPEDLEAALLEIAPEVREHAGAEEVHEEMADIGPTQKMVRIIESILV
ncbi:UDP-glycosyltransferase [Roseateles sp. DB2]|uniref:UDP-glycosyltransferase n=1 Tax=Roseateles sp. DB2 TaxID=3453717 RepID=UPI003EECCB30